MSSSEPPVRPEPLLGASTALEAHLLAMEERLRELSANDEQGTRATLLLEMARVLVRLGRGEEAWERLRPAFDTFLASQAWERMVETCEVLYGAEQPGSLSALGQGVWLAVSFPINPELTLRLLQHIVEDTPDDSDGAAVAAATAAYIADLRGKGTQREALSFFANRMLGQVAQRHGKVDSAQDFHEWVRRLELDDPDKFLVRLRNVIDVLVQDDWWIDRRALYEKLPVN